MVASAAAVVVSASIAIHSLAARTTDSLGKLKAALPAVTARLVIPVTSTDAGLRFEQRPTASATRTSDAPSSLYAPDPVTAERTGFLFTITMGVSASAGGEPASTTSPGPAGEEGPVPQGPENVVPQTEPPRSPAQASESETDEDEEETETESPEPLEDEDDDEDERAHGQGYQP